MNLFNETQHVPGMYRVKSGELTFADTCLRSRRMVQKGVRFVEIFHEAWDQQITGVKLLSRCRSDSYLTPRRHEKVAQ